MKLSIWNLSYEVPENQFVTNLHAICIGFKPSGDAHGRIKERIVELDWREGFLRKEGLRQIFAGSHLLSITGSFTPTVINNELIDCV